MYESRFTVVQLFMKVQKTACEGLKQEFVIKILVANILHQEIN